MSTFVMRFWFRNRFHHSEHAALEVQRRWGATVLIVPSITIENAQYPCCREPRPQACESEGNVRGPMTVAPRLSRVLLFSTSFPIARIPSLCTSQFTTLPGLRHGKVRTLMLQTARCDTETFSQPKPFRCPAATGLILQANRAAREWALMVPDRRTIIDQDALCVQLGWRRANDKTHLGCYMEPKLGKERFERLRAGYSMGPTFMRIPPSDPNCTGAFNRQLGAAALLHVAGFATESRTESQSSGSLLSNAARIITRVPTFRGCGALRYVGTVCFGAAPRGSVECAELPDPGLCGTATASGASPDTNENTSLCVFHARGEWKERRRGELVSQLPAQ